MALSSLPSLPLDPRIRESYVDCTDSVGLTFHILEAGFPLPELDTSSKSLILLLHGYPELAFSWRKIMPALSERRYHVVAVDQRGYGRTTGWEPSKNNGQDTFRLPQLVTDMVALIKALGYNTVRAVIGHDFGAISADMCALMRPDVFTSCITMSHPFKGPPSLPFRVPRSSTGETKEKGHANSTGDDVHAALANLPNPRKHYKWYNSTPGAAAEWDSPRQGLQKFLRGYVHLKSADWPHNNPYPLASWTATELAKLPTYYVMPLHKSMPEAVAEAMEDQDENATVGWLSEEDMAVYVQEWGRTGFGGALTWYTTTTDPSKTKDLLLFADKKIEVPSMFISGENDWGNYQEPGALDSLPKACKDFRGIKMIKHAGHWPQQEQPEAVAREILQFLEETG